jgi:hypothetical protein
MRSALARYLWIVTAVVAAALVLSQLASVLLPFALGALLACVCAPLAGWVLFAVLAGGALLGFLSVFSRLRWLPSWLSCCAGRASAI